MGHIKLSLKYKTIIGFSILFLVGFLCSNYIINKVVSRNNEDFITKELIDVKNSATVYTRQFFMVNGITDNSEQFALRSGEICKEISEKTGLRVNLYTYEGRLLASSSQGINQEFEGAVTDIKIAISGKSGFNINHNDVRTYVNYAFPITKDNQVIGIIRFTKDYSYLYQGSYNLLSVYRVSTSILFAALFIFTYIISIGITEPILTLAKCSEEIASGNYNVSVPTNFNDEIGELSSNFKYMAYQIEAQLNTIEKDRDALKEAEKNRKTFFDNVTHELKTPLTTILGYAQILEENGFTDEEFFYKGIDHIQSESKRLHRMVLQLLQISRENTMDVLDSSFQNIDVSGCIACTCDEMRVKSKKYGTNIVCELEKPLMLYGDERNIKGVLVNIIDNSIKYGKINSTIIVKGINEEKYVSISISDEGNGIPEKEINKIFEPFYRIGKTQNEEGAGLGLSISKTIIDKHHGEINVKSEMNVGSTFTIKIPKYNCI